MGTLKKIIVVLIVFIILQSYFNAQTTPPTKQHK